MAAISGQKTVAVAGTEEALGTVQVNGPLMVKALSTNTGLVYIGNNGDGTVSSSTGMPLSGGDAMIFEWVGSLGSIMVDAAVGGEGVAWAALDV